MAQPSMFKIETVTPKIRRVTFTNPPVNVVGADTVVQLPRPVTQLTGYARVRPSPGQQRRVTFRLHTDRLAYTGPDLERIVEPGEITVMIGASSTDIRLTGTVHLTGPVREAGHDRVLNTPADIG